MSADRLSPLLRSVAALTCILLAFAIARIPLPFPRLIGQDAVALEAVEIISGGPSGTSLSLPFSWTNQEGIPATRRFSVTLPPASFGQERRYLYVPFFEQRLQVVADGNRIYDSLDIRFWSGPVGYLSALIALPEGTSEPGNVDLLLDTGSVPRGTLSRVYLGPRDSFEASFRIRGFLEERVKPMLFGAQLLLGFVSFAIFWLRPSDFVFGWLGSTLMLTCILGNGLLMAYVPALEQFLREIYFLAPLAGLALLGFTSSLAGRPVPKPAMFIFPCLMVCSIGLVLHPDISLTEAARLGAVPAFVLAVCWSLIILFFSLGRTADYSVALFLISLVIIIYGVSHDFLMRTGFLEDGILISRIANALVMVGMATFLIGKQTETANALDEAAVTLRRKLAEREEELQAIHRRQQENERQNAISAERRRITNDLHDGVAGHLATIVALSETGSDSTMDINASAKNALVDLRLVLDALSLPEGSIGFALGSFRERCLLPLERLGIGIEWSMADFPDQTNLSREAILNILRILQEAVNNAVRHGGPKTLHVSGRSTDDGRLCFMVENAGGTPFSPDDVGSGLGLESMRLRAATIGGVVSISPTSTGAQVTLLCEPGGLKR